MALLTQQRCARRGGGIGQAAARGKDRAGPGARPVERPTTCRTAGRTGIRRAGSLALRNFGRRGSVGGIEHAHVRASEENRGQRRADKKGREQVAAEN